MFQEPRKLHARSTCYTLQQLGEIAPAADLRDILHIDCFDTRSSQRSKAVAEREDPLILEEGDTKGNISEVSSFGCTAQFQALR